MPVTIVATAGAVNANSYATEAEYIAYVATRLNAPTDATVTGSTASETEKKALIEATRELTPPPYQGERATGTQALAWPRVWAPDPDVPTTLVDPETYIPVGLARVVYYAETEIPQRVKDATCELAMQFVLAGTSDLASLDTSLNVTSETVGPLSTTYAPASARAQGLARFPRVLALLAPLFDPACTGGLTMRRV